MPLHMDARQDKPGTASVSLAGSLDSETAPLLDKTLVDLSATADAIALDLKGLTFISSAGLRVLFAAQKRQRAKGGQLAVSRMSPGVRKVFQIVNALPSMNVFASVEEMDAYLANVQKPQE